MEINVTPNRKLNLLKISLVGAYTFLIVTINLTDILIRNMVKLGSKQVY